MDQVAVPFFADMKFWSLVISIVALVLSQWKFFSNLFRRARLGVETYSQMYVLHRFGNPNIQLHLIISNIGGRNVRVKGIKLRLSESTGETFSIAATAYYPKTNENQTALFTPFSLLPGQEWAHIVYFYNYVSRQDDKFLREATSAMRTDINEKLAVRGKDEQNVQVCAEDDLVEPFRKYFERHFKWRAEEYGLVLSVDTEPANAIADQNFRFVLFESDAAEMRRILERYTMGFGICFPIDIPEGVFVPLQKSGGEAGR
jgi:hypothetical protein